MPKRRDETDAEWMARVRAARDFTSRAILSPERQRFLEGAAFMELFHPDHPVTKDPTALRRMFNA